MWTQSVSLGLALTCLAPAAASAAGTVWVVDQAAGKGADFVDIQSAVDVAASGDTILVREGNYSPFTVQGKGLVISADTGVRFTYLGVSTVDGLPAGERVVLAGIQPIQGAPLAQARIDLTNNLGEVWIQDSFLRGAAAPFGFEPALHVAGSAAVTVDECTLEGGINTFGDGGPAVLLDGATAALYDSELVGGAGSGGIETLTGFDGGPALKVETGQAFLSRCSLLGGAGGMGGMPIPQAGIPCFDGGNGGPALRLGGGSPTVVLRASSLAGGAAGPPFPGSTCAPGAAGQETEGAGTVQLQAGVARSLEIESPARVGDTVTLAFEGAPSDLVWWVFGLNHALSPDFQTFAGPSLLAPPATVIFLGVLDGAGELSFPITLQSFGPGFLPVVLYQQAFLFSFVDGGVLSAGRAMVLLEASVP